MRTGASRTADHDRCCLVRDRIDPGDAAAPMLGDPDGISRDAGAIRIGGTGDLGNDRE